MSSLFSLIFLVSLIYFIVLWRKKKGAKNTNNQELYQAISKKKRIVGIVCIAAFVLAGVTAPSTTKTATTTNTPQTKTENKKVETQRTLQQKALELLEKVTGLGPYSYWIGLIASLIVSGLCYQWRLNRIVKRYESQL